MIRIGDTLGVVTLAPVVLALFSRSQVAWKGRRMILVATMSLALALVVSVYIKSSEIENEKIAQDFKLKATRFMDLLA